MHDGGDKSGQSEINGVKPDVFTELREQLRYANSFPPDSAERIAHLQNISARLENLAGHRQVDPCTAAACVIDMDGHASLYLDAVPADETVANLLRHWGRRVKILAIKHLANE
ncbi:hypothetical protein AB7849_15565 [Rhodanobacter sp. 115]|uniref:hypothetical protein n=1 Tax=Rhodanobacter sp. FW021-MT20 TaxID=1162282 RepID=UPI0034E52331